PTDAVNYSENFNSGNGSWSAEAGSSSDYLSWEYDQVAFANTGSPSTNGWLTNLPDIAVYESSWVKSPCFDLSSLDRPMIELDIYRSLAKDSEGVILQATADGGSTWLNIGEVQTGLNWYSSKRINPPPAGQAVGWTGSQPFAADAGWTEARHDLEPVSGESRVQFRIAFASEHNSTETNREGFAFDNIRIRERSRKVLLEHFTNTSANNTREINGVINGLYNWFFDDMVKLEYHTSFPGMDPFNSHNTIVPALRGLYYGVSAVPYSIMNGGYHSDLLFSYNPDSLEVNSARAERLRDEVFSIDIQAVYQSSRVTADVSVTALQDLVPDERIIHVAIYEKLITNIGTINGAENFLNVVKTMLPNVAGTAVFDGWTAGQKRNWQFSWDYANVYDPGMIRVAAFIQNDDTREVYQAEALDATNLTTGLEDKELMNREILVYPNPATDYLYILFRDQEDSDDYRIVLYDQLGRSVLQEEIYGYENLKQISLESLSKGVYIAQILNGRNQPVKMSRVVILK
ncbi:MAG: T9SS type A sorting domain-containing protein, partial [Bacteroidales bacterium]|nr:T9SS type A sorting domain-containing protein [Bacteroidales bacterium]